MLQSCAVVAGCPLVVHCARTLSHHCWHHGSFLQNRCGSAETSRLHVHLQGGRSFRTIRDFMSRLYNVGDMRESAAKVLDVVKTQVPADNALIVMGHNGPAGLGAERHNICGVDWVSEAGDHGDPDLQSVLQQLQEAGRPVALVVFGHMHHTLKGALGEDS